MLNKKCNILIITSWSFNDPLIQTYTLPYVYLIQNCIGYDSKIYLYTQQQDSYYLNKELNDKNIKDLKNRNIIVLQSKYKKFGLGSALGYISNFTKLFFLIFFKKINKIHSWCTPAGAMGYMLSIFTRKPLIIDSFEPHAQPMVEGNTWNKNSWAYKILFFLEKKQLERAEEVICAVEEMIAYSQKTYGIKKEHYYTKPACVDLKLFSKDKIKDPLLLKSLSLENSIICVYAGKFGGLYLEDETFDFLKKAFDYWGDKFRVLLLSGHSDDEIEMYSKKSGIPSHLIIKKRVLHSEIPKYIGLADFAICPMKPLPSRRYGTPIKNGEYWALGLPVVITKNISDDTEIIAQNKIGSVLDDFSNESYLKSIKEIDSLLKQYSRDELFEKIRPIAEKYRNYKIAEKVYSVIYNR